MVGEALKTVVVVVVVVVASTPRGILRRLFPKVSVRMR
jgi:hypothetical protein